MRNKSSSLLLGFALILGSIFVVVDDMRLRADITRLNEAVQRDSVSLDACADRLEADKRAMTNAADQLQESTEIMTQQDETLRKYEAIFSTRSGDIRGNWLSVTNAPTIPNSGSDK